MNMILMIAGVVNVAVLIVFFVGLFKIARNTRESAEHLEKVRKFLVEIRDVLKAGGK